MKPSLMKALVAVVALAAYCAAEDPDPASHKAHVEQAADAPKRTDSAITLARKAAISTSESVTVEDSQKSQAEAHLRTKLTKLLPSLNAAAVGVARKAAGKAFATAQQPYVERYRQAVTARVAAERSEAEALKIAKAVHKQVERGAQEAIQALQAEETVARTVTQQKLKAAALLQAKYAAMKAQAPQEVQKQVKPLTALSSRQVHQSSASKVASYTAAADAAERKVAQDQATLAHAKAVFRQASHLKTAAAHLANQRSHYERQARTAPHPLPATRAPAPIAAVSGQYELELDSALGDKSAVEHLNKATAGRNNLQLGALGAGDNAANAVVPEEMLRLHSGLPGSTMGIRGSAATVTAPSQLLTLGALLLGGLLARS